MKRFLFIVLAVVWSIAQAGVKENFLRVELAERIGDVRNAAQLIKDMRADGSWVVIDYAAQDRSIWPCSKHLRNITSLASAWAQTHDETTAAAFHKAMAFWYSVPRVNSNWWWGQIGVPEAMGEAALFAEPILTAEEKANVIKTLEASKISMAGQNRVWLARNVMMRGMLTGNMMEVRSAADTIANEIFISSNEGIREDWCFHQHGRQMQFGNYGNTYVDYMTRFAIIFAGTEFAFSPERINILCNLLSQGFRWTLYRGAMDIAAIGRQLFPGAAVQRGKKLDRIFKRMRAAGYEIPTVAPQGFHYFFKSAYAVYHAPNWMASVKMATPEIVGCETWINGDNLLGGHMADGMLLMYATGNEYRDIFPLWRNWRLIPGITSYLTLPPVAKPPAGKGGYLRGANEANDITAHEQGIEFTLQREGLTAHKSYSFTANGVECTGSNISATNATSEVVTCVEHSFAQPNFKILPYTNGVFRVVNGEFEYSVFAPEDEVVCKVEEVSGSFREVCTSAPATLCHGRIFTLYIRHGVTPRAAKYHYCVRINSGKGL